MDFLSQLKSLWTALCRPFRRQAGETAEPDIAPPVSRTEPDPGEEFLKIHRGLRRLSLASDRSGEILQAVSVRLDEVQQTLLNLSRPRQAALALEEAELLRLLDQLDLASGVLNLPPAARRVIDGARAALLTASGWQALALAGAKPGDSGIRIAEFLGVADAGAGVDARIHRVLEQGYRRADGTLLRTGVVIAGPAHLDVLNGEVSA